MSTLPIGLIIETLVAVLLLITIGYCWLLNRRLQRLRADEQTLRATISELMTATEIAERAILGLKTTAAEADKVLGTRLREAEAMSSTLVEQIGEGDKIFARITQIAEAARSAAQQRPEVPAMPQAAPQVPQYAPQGGYANGGVPVANGYHEPERKRASRAADIRNAAEEATARLGQFRKRNGAAA